MTIRRQPSDFIVEEIVAPAVASGWVSEPPRGVVAFAVYRLGKRSLTTPEATSRLAGALGVKQGAIAYAGLKDKHAQTLQHVSVAGAEAMTTLPERGETEAWWFERVGWSGEAASAAWIAANAFEIVLRDLTRAASDELERAALALRVGKSDALAVVNYFGAQRFGSARHGEGFAARRLVDGDFLGALKLLLASPHRKDTGAWRDFTRLAASKWGKWKLLAKELPARQERAAIEVLARGGDASEAFESLPFFLQEMSVDAYQSHLWNAAVRGLVRDLCGGQVAEREDDFGAMLFPMSEKARGPLAGVSVPLPRPGAAMNGAWARPMTRALADEGLTLEKLRIPDLRRPSFTDAERDVLVEARRFEMSRAEADDMTTRSEKGPRRGMRVVRFELPRGAYATVVLRALGQ